MANVYLGSPPVWIIDTPSAAAITGEWTRIARIVWGNGTIGVQGDECTVTDAAGNAIFDKFAPGADASLETHFDTNKGKSFHGVKVTTLGHGVVRIYLA